MARGTTKMKEAPAVKVILIVIGATLIKHIGAKQSPVKERIKFKILKEHPTYIECISKNYREDFLKLDLKLVDGVYHVVGSYGIGEE